MAIKNVSYGGTDWADGDILYAADLNDTFDATYDQNLQLSGGAMTGDLNMNSRDIDNVGNITMVATGDIDMHAGEIFNLNEISAWGQLDVDGHIYPVDDCGSNLGSASYAWNAIYCDYVMEGECDIAELQYVENGPELPYGTIVEMTENNAEAQEIYDDLKKWSEELAELRPIKHAKRPFHKEIGRTCMWKVASERSTKCPSIISKVPTHIMGSNPTTKELYKQKKMHAIALSGSVPEVMVEGEFEVGDLIVSKGNGNAMVDNDAPFNQIIGWCKEKGKDRRIEIWVK
jgi:hypothetical protein